MAKKNSVPATRSSSYREEMAALAQEFSRDFFDDLGDELLGLEYLYANDSNPLAVWHAITLCHENALSPDKWPKWVLGYLYQSAETVVSIKPKGANDRALPSKFLHAFGCNPTPSHRWQQDLADLRMFIELEHVRNEYGEKKGGVLARVKRRYAAKLLSAAEQARYQNAKNKKEREDLLVAPLRRIGDVCRRWRKRLRGKRHSGLLPGDLPHFPA